MRITMLFVLLCTVALRTASVAADPGDAAILEKLEARWTAVVEEIGMSGVSVSIIRGDEVVYSKGFGNRSVSPNLPYTADTSSYIASITKTMVGAAVMALVEDGKVDLDAPVKQYLPRFSLIDEELAARITIRDLLCHRYGLSNPIITFAEAYSGVWDDDFYFTQMENAGSSGKWGYSNLHFTILGRVIQTVTGQKWQEYARDRLFEPMGMTNTTAYASAAESYDNVARPLVSKDGSWIPGPMKKSDSTMHAAGGVYASANDLALWTGLFLNDGVVNGRRILKPESIRQMLTSEVAPGTSFWRFERERMGLAWYLGTYKDELLVHHFGSYIGFHSHASFMPEHNIGVAVLTNNNEAQALLVHQIAADVYDALLNLPGEDYMPEFSTRTRSRVAKRRAEAKVLSSDRLTLSRKRSAYAGHYTSDKWGTLDLRVENKTLVGNLGDLPVTLHANKEDTLIMSYPLGQEVISFQFKGKKVVGVRIRSYRSYTMKFVKEK